MASTEVKDELDEMEVDEFVITDDIMDVGNEKSLSADTEMVKIKDEPKKIDKVTDKKVHHQSTYDKASSLWEKRRSLVVGPVKNEDLELVMKESASKIQNAWFSCQRMNIGDKNFKSWGKLVFYSPEDAKEYRESKCNKRVLSEKDVQALTKKGDVFGQHDLDKALTKTIFVMESVPLEVSSEVDLLKHFPGAKKLFIAREEKKTPHLGFAYVCYDSKVNAKSKLEELKKKEIKVTGHKLSISIFTPGSTRKPVTRPSFKPVRHTSRTSSRSTTTRTSHSASGKSTSKATSSSSTSGKAGEAKKASTSDKKIDEVKRTTTSTTSKSPRLDKDKAAGSSSAKKNEHTEKKSTASDSKRTSAGDSKSKTDDGKSKKDHDDSRRSSHGTGSAEKKHSAGKTKPTVPVTKKAAVHVEQDDLGTYTVMFSKPFPQFTKKYAHTIFSEFGKMASIFVGRLRNSQVQIRFIDRHSAETVLRSGLCRSFNMITTTKAIKVYKTEPATRATSPALDISEFVQDNQGLYSVMIKMPRPDYSEKEAESFFGNDYHYISMLTKKKKVPTATLR